MKRPWLMAAWPLLLSVYLSATLTAVADSTKNKNNDARLKVSIRKDTMLGVPSCQHTFSQIELLNMVRQPFKMMTRIVLAQSVVCWMLRLLSRSRFHRCDWRNVTHSWRESLCLISFSLAFLAFHRSNHHLLYSNDSRGDCLGSTKIIADIIALITSTERTGVWEIMEWLRYPATTPRFEITFEESLVGARSSGYRAGDISPAISQRRRWRGKRWRRQQQCGRK